MTFIEHKIEALDSSKQKLLCTLAYYGTKTSTQTLKKFAKKNQLTKDKMEGMMRYLQMNGMCYSNHWYDTYSIQSLYFLPAIRLLCTQHEEWIDEIKEYKTLPENELNSIRDAAIALMRDKKKPEYAMRREFLWLDTIAYLLPAAIYPELNPLIRLVQLDSLRNYFERVIDMLFDADITDRYDRVEAALESVPRIDVRDKRDIKEALALYRYYATGEYQPMGSEETLYNYILRGVHALHQGEYVQAGVLLQKALKIRNEKSSIKNVFLNMLNCYFLIGYYIKNATDTNEKKIKQFVKKIEMNSPIDMLPAYIVAYWHIDPMHKVDERTLLRIHTVSMDEQDCTLKSMANFLSAGFDVNIPNELIKRHLPRHAILQHEYQHFLPISDKQKQELNEKFGQPILFAEKPLERWRIVLNDLVNESLSQTGNTAKKAETQLRLAYILRGDRIEVREQSRKKDGGWYAGKEVASGRYINGEIACMDDMDRDIWRANYGSYYHLKPNSVLPYLVGTDKVMAGYYAPFAQVKIEEEKPCLTIEKSEKGFSIASNLPKLDGGNVYVKRINDTHYTVIRVDEKDKSVYQRMLELKRLPPEAEDKLREVLPQISQRVHIESMLLGNNENMPMAASQSLILLQARQMNERFFEICIVASTGAESSSRYSVGSGQGIVMDKDKEGNLIRVRRDLQLEKERLERLNAFLVSIKNSQGDLFGYSLETNKTNRTLELNEMLATLEYVGERTEEYGIEWPEGEKLSLRSVGMQKNWNVSLQQNSGWFNMEGEIEIDNDIIIGLDRLMQLNAMSRSSKYVQLNDKEYLVLSQAIRKQLAQLDALTVREKGKMKIPLTQAMLLDETLNGEVKMGRGDELQTILEKMHDSYQLNPSVPEKLNATLREYQTEGYRWMLRLDSWGAGACLADDMGLGKTIQTIAVLLHKQKQGASLIVAPTSVMGNWSKEIKRFAPSLYTAVLNEMDSVQRADEVMNAGPGDVILSTYGIVCTEAKMLKEKKWNVICLDEAHIIKNRETKTAQAIYELNGKMRIALTGTPLQNHLGELWSLFNFVNPGMLGSYDSFRRRFVLPIENGDKDMQELLRRIVLPFILRRTKKEVIKELPEKTEIQYRVDLSKEEMHAYEYIRIKAQEQLEAEQKVSVSVLAQITKLRQAACASSLADQQLDYPSSKLSRMMELVNEINEGNNRVLIFSQFTSFLKMVKDRLDKDKMEYLYLDGSTPMKERENLVRRFQEGENGIFIISLKAGGLGLNLTGANYVIHMDPWWNPAIEQQATDRAYRIGQDQKVTVYHLIAAHTIEEKIVRLHKTKRDLADSLLEGTEVSHKLTEEDLKELLS